MPVKKETAKAKDTAGAEPSGPTGRPAPDVGTLLTGFLERPLGGFLDELAAKDPVPGGGSAAAVAAAMGAALVAKAARASRDVWPEAGGIAAQAEALRSRLEPLAQADAQAYEEVLRLLAEPVGEGQKRRDAVLGAAFSQAATLPLRIAEAASNVAELGVQVARHGDPQLRPDAAAAVLLADAAVRVGAHLVRVNLATQAGDARVERADALVEETSRAARRALADR